MRKTAILIICILALSILTTLGAYGEPTRDETPSVPLNVSAAPKDNAVLITWDCPSGLTGDDLLGFTVLKGTTAGSVELAINYPGPFMTSYLDEAVVNGNTYFYSVQAINEIGSGPSSTPVSTTPRGPTSRPTDITPSYDSNVVFISWSPPEDENGAPVTGYVIFKGLNNHNITIRNDVPSGNEFTDFGLTNGVTYYYQLAAINDYGDGKLSDIIAVSPRTTPSPPLNLSAESGDSKVILTWNGSLDDGGTYITGYRVFRGSTIEDMVPIAYAESTNTYTDDTAENGETYLFSVAGVNGEGDGELAISVVSTPLGPPGKPLNLTLTPGDAQVTLQWKVPENTGGSNILGYNIYKNQHGEEMKFAVDAGDTLEYTVTDLDNGKIYYFQVRSYNAVGEGPGSNSPMIRPEPVPKTPENFRIMDMEGELKLIWTKPIYTGEYPYDEVLIYRGETESSLEFYMNISNTFSSHYDQDVLIGNVYYYEISIRSAIGEGYRTPTVTGRPYGRPSIPLSFEIETSSKTAILTWERPDETGGRVLEGYKIFRGTEPDTLTVFKEVDGTHTSYNDATLTDGRIYYYKISAFNMELEGYPTDVIDIIPVGPPRDPVGAKGFNDHNNGTIVIGWEAPISDGGDEVISYRIYRGFERDNLSFYKEINVGEDFIDDDIAPGMGYFYSLSAVNTEGEGVRSSVIYIEVPSKEISSNGGGSSPIIWIVIIGVVLLIMISIVILAMVQSNKRKKEEEEQDDAPELEESESEKEERLIMERRKMMEEFTEVSIDTISAHSHDHDGHANSYEDLYGKNEDAVTETVVQNQEVSTGMVQATPVPAEPTPQQTLTAALPEQQKTAYQPPQ